MSEITKKLKENLTLPDEKHLIVKALAGTGKTFSEIVGCAFAFTPHRWPDVVKGLGFEPVPSDEQAAVWEAFKTSQPRSIVYCAYNKSIVMDFAEKWKWLVDLLSEEGINLRFATVNSLGHRICAGVYGRVRPNQDRPAFILASVLDMPLKTLKRGDPILMTAVTSLVDKVKLTLTGWSPDRPGRTCFDPGLISDDELDNLASHFEIDVNGRRNRTFELVRQVLTACRDPDTEIDFNDQNWLPIVNCLPIPKADFLMVDEAQDLPRCKQEFCRQMGNRLVLTGDPNQAIYGFAGADTEAIPRMATLLGDRCETLTLTETRRCAKAVVEAAKHYVPQFRAHPENGEGKVSELKVSKYLDTARDGDMVLCRVNAPLVSEALKLIKAGRKAVIRGRDFGGQLMTFVKKFETVTDLLEGTDHWAQTERDKEERKSFPNETRLQTIEDRLQVIYAFAEGCTHLSEVLERMERVFAGKVCPTCGKHFSEDVLTCPIPSCKIETCPMTGYPIGPKLETPEGVLFSSIHRAKGLEAQRVFFLRTKNAPCPHPMAKSKWARKQEYNLLYVAISRAIEELYFVVD